MHGAWIDSAMLQTAQRGLASMPFHPMGEALLGRAGAEKDSSLYRIILARGIVFSLHLIQKRAQFQEASSKFEPFSQTLFLVQNHNLSYEFENHGPWHYSCSETCLPKRGRKRAFPSYE